MDPFFSPTYTYHLQVYCIKLKVHSTKSVVFQNMITAVPLWNHFSPSRLVPVVVVVVVFLTLTDPLRIQPWSQDRRNQTKSNRESEISRESRQKRTDKKVASKGHRRDKIENKNKNTDSRNKLEATA